MNAEQIKKENEKANRLGVTRTTPSSRSELITLVAGLLAHHSHIDVIHLSQANRVVDGLQLHGLLTRYE